MSKKEIDISNYEEWFIDHLDGSLSDSEEELLKAFLLANPGLATELEELDGVNLVANDISFADKAELLMPTEEELRLMGIAEEGSLAELQNLGSDELEEVKAWKRTSLRSDDSIIYPNKSKLLQKESTPIIPLWLIRTAIAASLLGAISIVFFQSNETIYEPREGLVEAPAYDINELLKADYSEFKYGPVDDASRLNPVKKPEVLSPLMAEKEEPSPEDSEKELELIPVETPQESFAQDAVQQKEEYLAEIPIQEPKPLFIENELPPIEEQEEESPSLNETLADTSSPVGSEKESSVKVYNSVFDFLKGTVRETVEESDLFAMEEVKKEDDYVKTSLRIGGFEFSRGKRRK